MSVKVNNVNRHSKLNRSGPQFALNCVTHSLQMLEQLSCASIFTATLGRLREISMYLKVLIVLFMIALVVSLGSGLYFLMMDQGNLQKKRLFTSLGVRLGLASGLLLVIVYGVATGQLGHRNPWDAGPRSDMEASNP